jgi:hypothetical protein
VMTGYLVVFCLMHNKVPQDINEPRNFNSVRKTLKESLCDRIEYFVSSKMSYMYVYEIYIMYCIPNNRHENFLPTRTANCWILKTNKHTLCMLLKNRKSDCEYFE